MQNKTLYLLILLSATIFSCSKDKDDDPRPDVRGYWIGYMGDVTRGALVSIINHGDGSSRLYVALNYLDTASSGVDKMNGRWKMVNGVFYGIYDARATSLPADTAIIQGIIQSPFVEMNGLYTYHGVVGGVPVRLLKQE